MQDERRGGERLKREEREMEVNEEEQEKGVIEYGVDSLPISKQQLYNYQRRSKILFLKL